MADLGTEWTKISNEQDIKSLINKDPNQQGKVTTRNVKVKASERKEVLVVKDIDLKPTSIHFKYNEHWAKEDTNHFHSILRRYNTDLPIEDYDNKDLLTQALQVVKHKRKEEKQTKPLVKRIKKVPEPKIEEDFTIDSEDEMDTDFVAMAHKGEDKSISTKSSKGLETLPGKTIDQVLYDDFKAKYVKVIHLKPLKIVWDNRRLCQNETLSARRIDNLRKQGISIESLKKNNPTAYYDSFNRCYDVGKYELNGKYYCRAHFRDKKYGRTRDEDFHD